MRTYTTEHTVYKFDELSDEAKQKALEKFVYINVDYDDWAQFILDEWTERLNDLGFEDIDIAYSGFYSQGDGASFTARNIDIKKYLKANKLGNKYPALARAKETFERGIPFGHVARDRWHNYVHWNTTSVYLEGDNPTEAQQEELDRLELEIQLHVGDLNKDIYKDLQDEYEYQTSDEAVTETIKANEYEFYEDGRLA